MAMVVRGKVGMLSKAEAVQSIQEVCGVFADFYVNVVADVAEEKNRS